MYHYRNLNTRPSGRTRSSAWGVEKPAIRTVKDEVRPAKAARFNVTSRGLNDEALVQAALAFLAGNGDQAIPRLARRIRTAGRSRAEVQASTHSFQTDLATLPSSHLQYAYVLPPASYTGPLSPEGYAARLLSRHADERIVSVLERELSLSHERHGEALRDLRRNTPEIYDLLIRGSPRSALEAARLSGPGAACLARPIVADHAMFLAIATGHLRIAELRGPAKSPLVSGWAGQAEWPTMRQVSHAALVGPAQVLYELFALPVAESASDEEALSLLQSSGLLEDDESSHRLISIAKLVQGRLPEHALARALLQHATHCVLKSTEPLKSLRMRDLNDAGWTRRSVTEEQFGVTASQGAVIVAINLAVQRERIDACIDAVLDERSLPSFDANPGTEKLSNNPLARLTEALRIAGKSDKSAPEEPGDRGNHNSKTLVKNTRKKIDKGEIDGAMTRLRIDPAVFFQRRVASDPRESSLTP